MRSDYYDYLIETRRKNLLRYISEIAGYASYSSFGIDPDQARNQIENIRSTCWHILEQDEVPGIWKNSYLEIRKLKKLIREIYKLSSSVQAMGNEKECLSKIYSICKEVLPPEN